MAYFMPTTKKTFFSDLSMFFCAHALPSMPFISIHVDE
jgi:hypothetical protein